MQSSEVVALTTLGSLAAATVVAARRRKAARTKLLASKDWPAKRDAFTENLTADDLLLITDFDATLTTGDSEQCHDMVGATPLLSEAFRAEFAPLLDWTTNANIDGVEWWDAAHSIMVKHGMPPKPLIPRLVREARMIPRPGALELLKRLELLNVPVLIVSAGMADVIEEWLRQHGALSENVTVCSNRLNYQADSTPKSVSPSPPITSFTKEYAGPHASAFFAQHKSRRAIVQLGDSLTDVDPARNVPYDHLLSIGFLNARPEAAKHVETFDAVVVGNEGSLQPVADLLDALPATTLAGKAIDAIRRSPSGRWLTSAASSPRSSPPRSPLSQ